MSATAILTKPSIEFNNQMSSLVSIERKSRNCDIEGVKEQVEELIAQSLSKIVEAMIERAVNGDNVAAKYLIDRILGKRAASKEPSANDQTMPHNNNAMNEALLGSSLNRVNLNNLAEGECEDIINESIAVSNPIIETKINVNNTDDTESTNAIQYVRRLSNRERRLRNVRRHR